MSTVKFVIAFAVVIGCFSTMYPRFIHPFIKRAFGEESSKPEGQANQERSFRPPNMPPMPPRDGADMRHHMRPGPHPGMRAAAEMSKQQGSQGSGRGMMGVVLPMYAVGIVLYLVYTLVKVFNKRDDYKNKSTTYQVQDKRMYDRQREPRYDDNQGFGDRVDSILGKNQGHQELEDLMCKADDKTITGEEMRILQQRLAETEQQMASILKAMQLVQHKIPDVAEEKTGEKAEAKITEITDNKDSKESSLEKSSDSSPDMDSFEIVKTASRTESNVSSIPDEEIAPDIEAETIQAKAVEEKDEVKSEESKPVSEDADVKKSTVSVSDEKETVEILKDKETEEKEGLDMRKRQGRDYQDD